MQRNEIIQHYKDNPNVPVLIIGGGVNGIGLFRELAAQDIDVLMVEMNDFCSGSSAASSHMLHGGLRYLENAEFRLVREALHERNRMLKNAPHYSRPLPTTIPIFARFSGMLNAPLKFLNLLDRPSERGAIVIKLGLTLYDWFVRNDSPMPSHEFHSRSASLAKRPKLNPDIIATATYYDAWMPTPERICMDLIHDAEAMHKQAHALNYVKMTAGAGDSVTLHDLVGDEEFTVQPQVVVNAAGPWIDFANRNMHNEKRYIGGTKGSHLVVDNPELHAATDGHEMFFENSDGRIVLFFPLQDRVLMGTTDIPIDDPDDAYCTPEEEQYILSMVKKVFPDIDVKTEDIVHRFSGVRPLPYQDASTPGQISRDHSIKVDEPDDDVAYPVLSLVGGKWTTYRAFGEQTGDVVMQRLGKPRKQHTRDMAIGGGKDYPSDDAAQQQWIADLAEETRLSEERARQLFDRYGTRAAEIAAFISGAPGDEPLSATPDYSTREVQYIADEEKVVHLSDFVHRRSLLAMLGKLNKPLLQELAAAMAEPLGWSAEEQEAQVSAVLQELEEKHGVALA